MEAHICQGNKKNRGRLSSSIVAKCVFCHIKFDARPLRDRSPPSSLEGPQLHEPVMLYT